jgi:hypothetical protein
MELNDAQKQTVAGWLSAGLSLSEIQKRLGTELGLSLTYMEVRFLVDDLKLVPKDAERPKGPVEVAKGSSPEAARIPNGPSASGSPTSSAGPVGPGTGQVSLTVDQISRPGALASGQVTFSDGQSAGWYLDQMGRLGLVSKQQGYKPSPADLQSFQVALERELAKMGM